MQHFYKVFGEKMRKYYFDDDDNDDGIPDFPGPSPF